MSSNANLMRRTVYEDSAFVIVLRIVGSDGQLVTQASIASIVLKVYRSDTGALVNTPSGTTLDVADVIFDTPQVDARWPFGDDADPEGTGYNFAYEVDGAMVPDGSKTYQVELAIEPAAGNGLPYKWAVELKTIPLFMS